MVTSATSEGHPAGGAGHLQSEQALTGKKKQTQCHQAQANDCFLFHSLLIYFITTYTVLCSTTTFHSFLILVASNLCIPYVIKVSLYRAHDHHISCLT